MCNQRVLCANINYTLLFKKYKLKSDNINRCAISHIIVDFISELVTYSNLYFNFSVCYFITFCCFCLSEVWNLVSSIQWKHCSDFPFPMEIPGQQAGWVIIFSQFISLRLLLYCSHCTSNENWCLLVHKIGRSFCSVFSCITQQDQSVSCDFIMAEAEIPIGLILFVSSILVKLLIF